MRIAFALTAFFISSAHAEYRAFELVIVDSTTGQERVVVTTLDPNQYRMYYPAKFDDKITYRRTWRCKGNTSYYKPICPQPDQPSLPAKK
jgi:hypothetical protein